jgi:hypothetical protein
MRKLARRAAIAGAGLLAIISCVGGADLIGPAHADNPECVANATVTCPRLVDAPRPDAPRPPRVWLHCQPAGPHGGAQCVQQP